MESFKAHRAVIIYNPVARALSTRLHLLQRIIDTLKQDGIETKLVATTGPLSAGPQTRREIEAGCDLVIAAGGDGTINEVAAGMLHTGVPLAILPGGTANVLARELHLPTHMERVAPLIPKMVPCPVSIGALQGVRGDTRYFVCMAGAGLDAEIVYRLNLDLKAAMGKLAYYVGGFGQVFRPLSEFELIIDGKEYQASFALFSRVRNYGGDLEIARGASLLRDEFDVVLFRGTVSAKYLAYLAGVAVGQAHRVRGCSVLRGRSIYLRASHSRDIYVQVDGELAGKLPASIEIVPRALELLVPQQFLEKERLLVAAPAHA